MLLAGSDLSLAQPTNQESLRLRLSWGHTIKTAAKFQLQLTSPQIRITEARPVDFEPQDFLAAPQGFAPGANLDRLRAQTQAGAGDTDGFELRVQWARPTAAPRKPHEIWAHLLQHGEPGQVARLKEDPGLQPDAPLLTIITEPEATRGFSIALEQLQRHKAMWLPEHDIFITLAEGGVEFRDHLQSLKGQRVLDRIKAEPEATLAEWTHRWADFGDPTISHHGQETSWLGTKGHLTGAIARHGSLYKFGIDRWGNVRPDFASPHRFRLDLQWPGGAWAGQRIENGLPLLITTLTNQNARCEIEQFAVPLSPTPPAVRGEVKSVLLSKVRIHGTEKVQLRIDLTTESTNRHPELKTVSGRPCVVDRETGSIWLMVDAPESLQVRAANQGEGSTRLELSLTGEARNHEPSIAVLKLASPPIPAGEAAQLAQIDHTEARHQTVAYWEAWLAKGARFQSPEPKINALFRANLWHALFLPRYRVDEHGVDRIDLPYSNFAYGQLNADWPINEAVYVDYMIYGLRGHFDVAQEEFAAMYHSQQKPDGRVGGYAEWGVYSPGMLYSIGQNYLLSRNRAQFDQLLPASLKALDWCLQEIARGKKSAEAPGLIIAPLNDLTHDNRAWGFPNAYFVAGLEVFGQALRLHNHPRGEEVESTARRMRADVERAFAKASVRAPAVQLADGTWIHYVPCDAMTPRRLLDAWYPTDVDCGSLHMSRLTAVDPRGWLTTAMLHDHEDNLFLDQWGMANEPVYNQQATAYLRRDEPEAVIRSFYSMIACAFSHEQLTPLEHRWAWGQYYMPPSTDGAWFELYRNMLVTEWCGDGSLFLGKAIPRAWLKPGKSIEVEDAPTYFGPVTCQFRGVTANGNLSATVQLDAERRPKALFVRFRHPDKQPMRTVAVNGKSWTDFDPAQEWVRIPFPSETAYDILVSY